MNSAIVRAAAREVLEAYNQAILRGDLQAALFWRPIVVERLELLSGDDTDSAGVVGVDGDESEGRGGAL